MNSFSGRPGVGKVDGNTTWADIVRGKSKRSRGGEELPAKAEGEGNSSLLSVADTFANASVSFTQKKRGGKAARAANSAAGAQQGSSASANKPSLTATRLGRTSFAARSSVLAEVKSFQRRQKAEEMRLY